jgi:hypothetical protein
LLTFYKGIRKKAAKIMRYFLALVLSLLPLAFGRAPFPSIASFTGTMPTAISSAVEASLTAYGISVENQPSFTSWAGFMATATDLSTDESNAFAAADNNPVLLAIGFITATATPAWYTEIPDRFRSYVSSIASVAASIAEKAESESSGAERVEAKVAVMGSLLATMLVVMLLL